MPAFGKRFNLKIRQRVHLGLMLLLALPLPEQVLAGAIADAKPLTVGLSRVLDFLLGLFGILAVMGFVLAGILYFFAGGDPRRVTLAKRAFMTSIVGVVITLGCMVIVWTIAQLLSY